MDSAQTEHHTRSSLTRLVLRVLSGTCPSMLLIAWGYTALSNSSISGRLFLKSGSLSAGVDTNGWHFADRAPALMFSPAAWSWTMGHQHGEFYQPGETATAEWQHLGLSFRQFWVVTGTETVVSFRHALVITLTLFAFCLMQWLMRRKSTGLPGSGP